MVVSFCSPFVKSSLSFAVSVFIQDLKINVKLDTAEKKAPHEEHRAFQMELRGLIHLVLSG